MWHESEARCNRMVPDAAVNYYRYEVANIHRGMHPRSSSSGLYVCLRLDFLICFHYLKIVRDRENTWNRIGAHPGNVLVSLAIDDAF